MSLKVWLPLDGDLRNLGASSIEVVNNGATIDNAGKIGKCYYFDGNGHYLQLSESVGDLYSSDFSWAVWLKPTDSTRSIISSEYSSTGSSNVAFELSASRGVRIYWNGSPDIYPANSTLPIDTWTHVAITKTTGTIKTYLNGQLTNTYTGTLSDRSSTSKIRIGDDYRGGTSVSYKGYMNDWRLYDHCLSAAEVHEIAMGLVLHYKLDGGVTDSTIVSDNSGYGYNGTINGVLTTSSNTAKYNTSTVFNGSSYVTIPEIFENNVLLSEFTWTGWVKRNYTDTNEHGIYNGITYIRFRSYNNNNFLPFISWNHSTTSESKSNSWTTGSSLPEDTWTHIAFTFKNGILKYYCNGNYISTSDRSSTGQYIKTNYGTTLGSYGTSNYWKGNLSDVRVYTTQLLDNDIKLLYNVGMKVDNLGEIHSFEFKESGGKELIQGIQLAHNFTNHDENSNPYLNYNSDGEIILTGSSSIGSKYIPTSPTGKTYYYDIEVSIAANNLFCFGFERYDADKTARSNNACVYVIAEKRTSDLSHKRYFGTVDLSTDDINPCAFIAVRILNDWSNASGRTAIVHRMSLREVSTFQKPKLYKTGTFLVDELNEHQKAVFHNNNIIEATEFIEK